MIYPMKTGLHLFSRRAPIFPREVFADHIGADGYAANASAAAKLARKMVSNGS
jgi:hypothetical protein